MHEGRSGLFSHRNRSSHSRALAVLCAGALSAPELMGGGGSVPWPQAPGFFSSLCCAPCKRKLGLRQPRAAVSLPLPVHWLPGKQGSAKVQRRLHLIGNSGLEPEEAVARQNPSLFVQRLLLAGLCHVGLVRLEQIVIGAAVWGSLFFYRDECLLFKSTGLEISGGCTGVAESRIWRWAVPLIFSNEAVAQVCLWGKCSCCLRSPLEALPEIPALT